MAGGRVGGVAGAFARFTHGATMSGIGPPGDLPISFHAIRGAAQIVLLSLLWGIYTNPYRDKCPVP